MRCWRGWLRFGGRWWRKRRRSARRCPSSVARSLVGYSMMIHTTCSPLHWHPATSSSTRPVCARSFSAASRVVGELLMLTLLCLPRPPDRSFYFLICSRKVLKSLSGCDRGSIAAGFRTPTAISTADRKQSRDMMSQTRKQRNLEIRFYPVPRCASPYTVVFDMVETTCGRVCYSKTYDNNSVDYNRRWYDLDVAPSVTPKRERKTARVAAGD